jgi:hypothetical protein
MLVLLSSALAGIDAIPGSPLVGLSWFIVDFQWMNPWFTLWLCQNSY